MSLPMLSGSCWTKRTTESNRTAPEILRGFFAPYPPADASCRTSGHTPPNPLTADLPATQAQTHTAQPPSPLSSPSPASPFPHSSPIQALLPPKRSPTRPTLSRHAGTGTDPHGPAAQPAIFPVTNSPIPAHLSSSSDPYKNPGSRPPPGFFVISGSVRSPSQRRLR